MILGWKEQVLDVGILSTYTVSFPNIAHLHLSFLIAYPGKTLVVCPASLIGQWEDQVKQHCKRNVLNVLVHHGKPRELQAKRLARYDLVITTYGIIGEENKYIVGKNRKVVLCNVLRMRL